MKKFISLIVFLTMFAGIQSQVITISKVGNGILISNVNGTTDYYLTTLSQVNVNSKMITFYSYGFPDPVRVWYDNISANFGLPTATLYVDSLNSLGYFPNTESDPVFVSHLAYNITAQDTTWWGTKGGGTSIDTTRLAYLDKPNTFDSTNTFNGGGVEYFKYKDSLDYSGYTGLRIGGLKPSSPSYETNHSFLVPYTFEWAVVIDSILVNGSSKNTDHKVYAVIVHDTARFVRKYDLFNPYQYSREGISRSPYDIQPVMISYNQLLDPGEYWFSVRADSIDCMWDEGNYENGVIKFNKDERLNLFPTDTIPNFKVYFHYYPPDSLRIYSAIINSIKTDSIFYNDELLYPARLNKANVFDTTQTISYTGDSIGSYKGIQNLVNITDTVNLFWSHYDSVNIRSVNQFIGESKIYTIADSVGTFTGQDNSITLNGGAGTFNDNYHWITIADSVGTFIGQANNITLNGGVSQFTGEIYDKSIKNGGFVKAQSNNFNVTDSVGIFYNSYDSITIGSGGRVFGNYKNYIVNDTVDSLVVFYQKLVANKARAKYAMYLDGGNVKITDTVDVGALKINGVLFDPLLSPSPKPTVPMASYTDYEKGITTTMRVREYSQDDTKYRTVVLTYSNGILIDKYDGKWINN